MRGTRAKLRSTACARRMHGALRRPASTGASSTRAEEVLDAPVDAVFVLHLGQHDFLVTPEVLAEVLDELAGAVGRLDLPIRELIRRGQDAVAQQRDAQPRVVDGPV